MIRVATISDIKDIKSLGKSFYHEAKFQRKGLNLDLDSFGELVEKLINSNQAIVLVGEKDNKVIGSIGGAIGPWVLDTNQTILQELWWYVYPEHRGLIGTKLIKAFEKEAKKYKVNFVLMITVDTKHESTLVNFYKRQNYKHLEHHFMKQV